MKYIEVHFKAWLDEKTGQIKLVGADGDGRPLWTSITDRPTSKRYHRNLYRKLAERLGA